MATNPIPLSITLAFWPWQLIKVWKFGAPEIFIMNQALMVLNFIDPHEMTRSLKKGSRGNWAPHLPARNDVEPNRGLEMSEAFRSFVSDDRNETMKSVSGGLRGNVLHFK